MTASPAKTMAETAVEFGLKPDEYAVILKRLNRELLHRRRSNCCCCRPHQSLMRCPG
jgi:hypothetical protein